jgi:hypothetical protein
MAHFAYKVAEKVRTKQARLVDWDKINNPPPQRAKTFTNSSHSSQIEDLLLNFGFIVSPAPHKWRGASGSE